MYVKFNSAASQFDRNVFLQEKCKSRVWKDKDELHKIHLEYLIVIDL